MGTCELKPLKIWYQKIVKTNIWKTFIAFKNRKSIFTVVNHCTYSVLVEKVEDCLGKPLVTPVTVDQKKVGEESESSHSEIASHHCLHALLTR